MKASGLPFGVKIDKKKEHHPIYHLSKMYDAMMLFKPDSNKDLKDFHQFSCKIQVLKYLRILLQVKGTKPYRLFSLFKQLGL